MSLLAAATQEFIKMIEADKAQVLEALGSLDSMSKWHQERLWSIIPFLPEALAQISKATGHKQV